MKLEVDPIFSPVKITFEAQEELTHLALILSSYIETIKHQRGDTVDFAYSLLSSIRNRVK